MKHFKYRDYLVNIKDCPRITLYKNRAYPNAFRWVYADISDERNFEPPAIRSKRANAKMHAQECGQFATSFHKTLLGSKAQFHELHDQFEERAWEYFGTHIAVGDIHITDGESSAPDGEYEHFDIHLYETNNVNGDNFKIVEPIIIDD